MQFPRKPRRSPAINIINLIDVLVVLLIFYIATTVFKKSEPKINIVVPNSTTATTTQETPPSIIYVTTQGKIFLDDAPVEPEQLGGLLKGKIAANASFKVAMKADTQAPFGAIIKVMDAAHTAGIADLPTFAEPPKAPGDSGP
ncbi:MAG TPA: biopolymer transporter ExbD [Candidatus Methylacidiphilales bacterium]|jgi:biopolymer transport protein ExbD|nr:biopolymer transporter ExbD [Candidatus Methylacidiphilales bacterium]